MGRDESIPSGGVLRQQKYSPGCAVCNLSLNPPPPVASYPRRRRSSCPVGPRRLALGRYLVAVAEIRINDHRCWYGTEVEQVSFLILVKAVVFFSSTIQKLQYSLWLPVVIRCHIAGHEFREKHALSIITIPAKEDPLEIFRARY